MKARFNQSTAEELAIRALGYLAGDAEKLSRFLDTTGLDPSEIRAAAASPSFWVAVLDHFLSDESLLLAFAADEGLDPASIAAARAKLAPYQEEGLRDG